MAELGTISFEDARTRVEDLRRYLEASGVVIHPVSVLHTMLNAAGELVDAYLGKDVELRDGALADTANAIFLADCILGVRGTEFEDVLRPHLSLVRSGDPRMLGSADGSLERNKLFEVVCACVLSRFADEVRFEEPDVVARMGDDTWGLACKAPTGTPRSVAQNIRKGFKQIERARTSGAIDLGVVVVQATNHFGHEKMIPRLPGHEASVAVFGSFRSPNRAVNVMNAELKLTTDFFEEARHQDVKKNPVRLTTASRAVLYVVNTLCIVRKMLTKAANCRQVNVGMVAGPEDGFCRRFGEFLQRLP